MQTGASLKCEIFKTHFGELETLIHRLEKMPDVLCSRETWLNSGDDASSLLVTGYHQYALKTEVRRVVVLRNSWKVIMISKEHTKILSTKLL